MVRFSPKQSDLVLGFDLRVWSELVRTPYMKYRGRIRTNEADRIGSDQIPKKHSKEVESG